jgi:chromosome segregation ATPase
MTAPVKSRATLADRIAEALRVEAATDVVANLIAEAETAQGTAEEARDEAHARSLDPISGADAATAAKREADNLQFEIDRLTSALEALRTVHGEAQARENDARRRASYEAAQAERDALVEELREVYPAIENRLADLVGRVAANNAVLDRVNRRLPTATSPLASAEMVARGGRERFDSYQ